MHICIHIYVHRYIFLFCYCNFRFHFLKGRYWVIGFEQFHFWMCSQCTGRELIWNHIKSPDIPPLPLLEEMSRKKKITVLCVSLCLHRLLIISGHRSCFNFKKLQTTVDLESCRWSEAAPSIDRVNRAARASSSPVHGVCGFHPWLVMKTTFPFKRKSIIWRLCFLLMLKYFP